MQTWILQDGETELEYRVWDYDEYIDLGVCQTDSLKEVTHLHLPTEVEVDGEMMPVRCVSVLDPCVLPRARVLTLPGQLWNVSLRGLVMPVLTRIELDPDNAY